MKSHTQASLRLLSHVCEHVFSDTRSIDYYSLVQINPNFSEILLKKLN